MIPLSIQQTSKMFVANLPQQPHWNTRIWNMAMHKFDKPRQIGSWLFVLTRARDSLVPRPCAFVACSTKFALNSENEAMRKIETRLVISSASRYVLIIYAVGIASFPGFPQLQFLICDPGGCVVSRASRIFLFFRWENFSRSSHRK